MNDTYKNVVNTKALIKETNLELLFFFSKKITEVIYINPKQKTNTNKGNKFFK